MRKGSLTSSGGSSPTSGNFVGPHVAVWNTFFALIQVAIGAGLLFRRTVRPALAISFFWAFGVWFFGEGLGLILTGSASALTGAPGSVFMYGLIGLMAWPRRAGGRADESLEVEQKVGVASSAAAQGIGGAVTPLAVWSGFWALAAILFLLPDNRTQTSVSSAISGMSSGEPSAYAHFLTHFGNHFGSVGTQSAWLLAMASLVIGAGPLWPDDRGSSFWPADCSRWSFGSPARVSAASSPARAPTPTPGPWSSSSPFP